MRNNVNNFFLLSQLAIFGITFIVNNYNQLVIIEGLIVLFFTLDKWGKGIILREIIALHAVLVLLIIPLLGYKYYTIENPISRLWVKYMPISEYDYYSFVFPAVLIYILILCWPIKSKKTTDEGPSFIQRIQKNSNQIIFSSINPQKLVLGSSGIYMIIPFLPVQFQYIGYLCFTASFAGFLMIYMDKGGKHRNIYLLFFVAYISYVALSSTMFTLIIYMGMTISSFLFLNLSLSFSKKIMWFLSIVFFVLTLQSVKGVFRYGSDNQNKILYLTKLISDEVSKGYVTYNADRFFPFYIRANQGFMVAKVIGYVPSRKNFDNGTYLGTAIASSLIPRMFWPDKPMAGGRFTTKYFTGEELVGNTSMNVSPVGEAYGSFGYVFGIVYMGVLAFFIRYVYVTFLSLSNKIPLLIFWFPVIFFQVTYSMETDSLQIFNSLIKSSIFVFILYTFSPTMFGVKTKA